MELSTQAHRADTLVTSERAPSGHGDQPAARLAPPLRWLGARPILIVAVIAVAAGVWAVVGSHWAFRYLSDDHDEGLYLLQATALADGHLFPPAPKHADAFIPWLSVLSGDRFILKYTPVHASFLALGIRLLGSPRWSLGLIAAAVVALTYVLAKEVLRDRKAAVLATAFLGLSPLFLIQSALFLPYCSNLLLLEGFAFTLLRGLRTNSPRFIAGSGLVLGLAAFARPFDALVFALPMGVYFLIAHRREGRRLVRNAGWFALGAALPVAAILLYYRAATGSPFRPPFNLLEPQDTIGFGPRKLLPGHPTIWFTPALGWEGVTRHVLLTSFWGFGGLLLVGFFLLGLLRRVTGPQVWMAVAAVSFSLGYVFFWGTYGTSLHGSLTSFLGPFYFLPVLLCVALLAGKGFRELWHRDWVLGVFSFAAMVAVSGYLLVEALRVNVALTAEDRRLYAPVRAADLDRALVLLPRMWGHHLLHPFAWLQNDADYDGETVYALDRGDPANLDLIEDYSDRAVYRLRVHGHYRRQPPDPALTTSLERLTVREVPSLETDLSLENPTDDPYVMVSLEMNGVRDTYVLDTSSQRGQAYQVRLSIAPGSAELHGPFGARLSQQVEERPTIAVEVATAPGDLVPAQTLYRREIAYTVEGPGLRLLLPGIVSVNGLGADPLVLG